MEAGRIMAGTEKLAVVSEGPVKITKATIEAAWRRRQKNARLILRDEGCRGLALIVNANAMAWSYSYRPRGTDPVTGKRLPNRTVTIGNPETHNSDEARIAANKIKGAAASGEDPAVERKAKQLAERKRRAVTMGRLVEDYAIALPRRPKLRGTGMPSPAHAAEELAQVRAAMAMMDRASTPIAELDPADVRQMLGKLGDKPATARARYGALSRFFDWCQDEGHIAANPCALLARTRRPKVIPPRAHHLPVVDVVRLWKAAEALSHPVYRDLARFLLAAPCRRGEAARLDWGHLDLDAAVWTMPGAMTKNGDAHRLHLHPLALDLLRARHEAASKPRTGLVFPAPKSGEAIDTFSAIKADLDKAAGLTGWRWHDLRRSFATALAEAGVAEAVADAVLNHRQAATRGGVLGVYQRSKRWPEQVEAMQRWGVLLTAGMADNVVTLRAATA
jgi:integrase